MDAAAADALLIAEIWDALLAPVADIIEEYAADPRGPSCLILAWLGGRPLHAVVAYPSSRYATPRGTASLAFLVTVWRPDLRAYEWSSDFRTRLPSP